VLALPRAAVAHVIGELVEVAITADHEEVDVGDGAQSLVPHGSETPIPAFIGESRSTEHDLDWRTFDA